MTPASRAVRRLHQRGTGWLRSGVDQLRTDRKAFRLALLALAFMIPVSITAGLLISARAAAGAVGFGIAIAAWAAVQWLEPPDTTALDDPRGEASRRRAYRLARNLLIATAALFALWAFVNLDIPVVRHVRDWLLMFEPIEFLIAYSNGLGLFAGIIAYAAFGAIVRLWRTAEKAPSWRGPVLTLVGAGMFAAGLRLLVPDNAPEAAWAATALEVAAIALIALPVAITPIGIALWSEDALKWTTRRAGWWPWVLLGASLVAGVSTIAYIVWQVGDAFTDAVPSLAVVIVCSGLFVMVGLLVSRTQLDTVLIAGLGAVLLALAPGVAPPPPDPDPAKGPVVVALGDSYVSGEGAGEFYRGTDAADVNECRRAPTAYARLFADAHSDDFPGGLVSFGCSGAVTANLTLVPQHEGEPVGNGGEPQAQLEQLDQLLADGVDVDLILLSIGGNDSGFATVGMTCVAPGNCATQEKLWTENLANVRLAMREVYEKLRERAQANDIPVATIPYPDPIRETRCPKLTLRQTEVEFVTRFVRRLDFVIKDESGPVDFSYVVGMKRALADQDLRLCDKPDDLSAAGINFISPQSVTGSPEQIANPANWVHSSFHPDETGHAAMAAVLGEWWAENRPGSEPSGTDPEQDDPDHEAALDVEPQCALDQVGVDEDAGLTCEDQASRWALEQSRDWVEDHITWFTAAIAGLWLFWFAAAATGRRLWPRTTAAGPARRPQR